MPVRPIANASVVVIPDFGKFESTVKGFAGRAAGMMGSLTAAVTGVGLAGLVSFGIKSAASLEQAQIGFETMLGSGKKASAFLSQLQKFAAATPFELPGLIEASRTLLGVGVSAKQVIPTLTAFGDAAGALGIQQDAFQRIMIAVSQSISAGKIKLGDMNQLMNNGLPIWKLMSEAMHKPVPALQAMISHGQLLSKDVLPALQKQMEKDYGGAMARQSQTLAGVWSTLKDTVAIGLANAIKPLVPMMENFLPKAATAASSALAWMSKTVVTMVGAFKTGAVTSKGFMGAIENVGATIGNVVQILKGNPIASEAENGFTRVAEQLKGMLPKIESVTHAIAVDLVNAFKAVIPLVSSIVGWFTRHRDVTITLLGVMAALVAVTKVHAAVLAVEAAGGLVKYIAQINIVQAVTKVWAAVQWVLNAALTANPIGIVVVALAALVAGLIFAWKHSQTFRDVVIGTWNGIRAAVGAVASWFTNTLWPIIRAVWDGIAAGAMWLWHTQIEPVWHGIQRIIQAASAIIQLAIALVVAYIRNVLAPTYVWVWKNVVAPVWRGIQSAISTAVNFIRGILSAWMGWFRTVMAPQFLWLWHTIIQPIWNGIKGTISTVVSFLRGIFQQLGTYMEHGLVQSFRNTVTAIGKIWSGLKAVAKAPVTFVVNSVINPLIGGFNKLAKVFHTPTIDKIGGFEEGGQIPGAPSSRDNRLAWLTNGAGKVISNIKVATGEFIVNARDTAKALPLLQWINAGMRGGPTEAAKRIGRQPTQYPGDGSEGWAFSKGGLVGFLSNVWDALSNPIKAIKSPLESAMGAIPGGGLFKQVLTGMGHKLIDGLFRWATSWGGGSGVGSGNIQAAQNFVRAQAGKPYVWASAGPGGYDCSGIVSAVYNVLKGHNPYDHTFSTESLPGKWFNTSAKIGPLVAGWSHPGQRPASASVGHMAGMIGGLPFESTGSRGVHVGASARRTTEFANSGVARARGGLVELAKIARADFGSVTLARGHNLIYNGLGRPEHLSDPGSAGQPMRWHPADLEALGRIIGREMSNAIGAGNYAAGRQTRIYTRGG